MLTMLRIIRKPGHSAIKTCKYVEVLDSIHLQHPAYFDGMLVN